MELLPHFLVNMQMELLPHFLVNKSMELLSPLSFLVP
jgi:hypothetical protein